jgi:ABC-type antimicrobial peptide transport system permease subunit
VGQGLALVLVSIGIGVAGALALARVVSGLLYGIGPRDPVTYLAVVGILGLVGGAACYLPARRASAVSPQTALRTD